MAKLSNKARSKAQRECVYAYTACELYMMMMTRHYSHVTIETFWERFADFKDADSCSRLLGVVIAQDDIVWQMEGLGLKDSGLTSASVPGSVDSQFRPVVAPVVL